MGSNEAIWETVTSEGRWQGEIGARRKDGTGYAALVTIDAVQGDPEPRSSYVVSIFACAPIREAFAKPDGSHGCDIVVERAARALLEVLES